MKLQEKLAEYSFVEEAQEILRKYEVDYMVLVKLQAETLI